MKAWLKDLANLARVLFTLFLLVVIGVWLIVLGFNLAVPPVLDGEGDVLFDQFVRAKDILTLVLPLLTLAFGYWFGSAQGEKAEAKLDAITAEAPEGLLKQAMDQHPEAFGLPKKPA